MSGAQIEPFGTDNGIEIQQITLTSKAGAEAKIITWGAVIRDLLVPSKTDLQRVVLGLNSLEDYKEYSPHFGAIPGRFANRIAGGHFTLDGKGYDLPHNDGANCLHGGPDGFGRRPWTIQSHTANSVTLTLHSPDGDAGFPGALDATCVYTLEEPATLRFELSATCDAPTVVNLTNHSYFNLDGSADILDHELTLHSDSRTPTNSSLIPTGEIASVAGTPYDFRKSRPIRNEASQAYDMNYVVSGKPDPELGLVHAAAVRSPKSGVTLNVFTNQPGIQFYDSKKLNCPVPGLGGARYGSHAGLCLETQAYPDAPNHPNFPSTVLRPGGRYTNTTEFRFG